jgi:hypothetical protein
MVKTCVTEPRYANKTLDGNWWEDRNQTVDNNTGAELTGKERVLPQDNPNYNGDYKTTNAAFQDLKTYYKTPATGAVMKRPTIMSDHDALDRISTLEGPSSASMQNLGLSTADLKGTTAKTMESLGASHFQTTNSVMYVANPKAAQAKDPEIYAPSGTSHGRRAELDKTVFRNSGTGPLEPTMEDNVDKARRGPMTRRPQEGGNPYGVSVYVDEYAEWGTKVAGKMTWGESTGRMQTKYF